MPPESAAEGVFMFVGRGNLPKCAGYAPRDAHPRHPQGRFCRKARERPRQNLCRHDYTSNHFCDFDVACLLPARAGRSRRSRWSEGGGRPGRDCRIEDVPSCPGRLLDPAGRRGRRRRPLTVRVRKGRILKCRKISVLRLAHRTSESGAAGEGRLFGGFA